MGVDIVERIQKLLAKADSTTSMEEAETIMTMVHGLLQKHGVSLLQVARYANEYDPVGTTDDAFTFWASDNWARRLSNAAGEYYGVRVIWFKRGNKTTITVVGRESCRAAFIAMMPYICKQVRRLAERGYYNYLYQSKGRGCTQIAIALGNRLYALAAVDERTQRPRKEDAGHRMLVPVDLVEQEMAQLNVKMVGLKTKTFVTRQALRDAETVSLADQLRRDGVPVEMLNKPAATR